MAAVISQSLRNMTLDLNSAQSEQSNLLDDINFYLFFLSSYLLIMMM